MAALLKDEAYEKLLEMINGGIFRPGETYSLNKVSEDLNMSRTPVRDAIQRLNDEGRVDILPSRGFRLHRASPEEMLRRLHFSCAIEGYCVFELSKKYREGGGRKYVDELKTLLTQLGTMLDDSTPFSEYHAVDTAFHRVILESIEDEYFGGLQYGSMGFFDHPEIHIGSAIPRQSVYNIHAKILDRILAGDPHGAYDAMVEHGQLMSSRPEP